MVSPCLKILLHQAVTKNILNDVEEHIIDKALSFI